MLFKATRVFVGPDDGAEGAGGGDEEGAERYGQAAKGGIAGCCCVDAAETETKADDAAEQSALKGGTEGS